MRSEATDHCASAFCPKRICKISSFLLTSWSSSLTRFGIITYLKNEPSRSQTRSFSPLVRRKQKDHHNRSALLQILIPCSFCARYWYWRSTWWPRTLCSSTLLEGALDRATAPAHAHHGSGLQDGIIESFFTEKKNCGKTLAAAAITFLLAVNDCTERSR